MIPKNIWEDLQPILDTHKTYIQQTKNAVVISFSSDTEAYPQLDDIRKDLFLDYLHWDPELTNLASKLGPEDLVIVSKFIQVTLLKRKIAELENS